MGNMKNASVLAKRTEEENSKKEGIQDMAKEHITKFQDVSKACSEEGVLLVTIFIITTEKLL